MKKIDAQPGEIFSRRPNKPILSFKYGYIWIGNDAHNDKWCYCTISSKRALKRLARAILKEIK